jgi:hypothetical protein
MLLIEHKSRGGNLDPAYIQALDYFPGITERDLPKYILVSDFAWIRFRRMPEWANPKDLPLIPIPWLKWWWRRSGDGTCGTKLPKLTPQPSSRCRHSFPA